MSSLLSESDLSRQDLQPGSDVGGPGQDVNTSPESVKASSGLLSTSSRETTGAAVRTAQLLRTLEMMTRDVTPSTDHSHRPGLSLGPAVAGGREDPTQAPGVVRLLNEVLKECANVQTGLQALNQAIHQTPGIPGRTADLIRNDLSALGHEIITIGSFVHALGNEFDEHGRDHRRDLRTQQAAHEATQAGLRSQLAKANSTIDEFQARIRQIEKNSKGELEAKAQRLNEKVNNQKRRINEQQAQIETLKRKLSHGSKLSKLTINEKRDDNRSPPPEFNSATSELTYKHRRSPSIPQPKMGSAITHQDQSFLLNNLNRNIDGRQGFPPHQGANRTERGSHFQGGFDAAPPSFGQFGHQLPSAVGPNTPMGGAPGYYGPYPPVPPYGQQTGGHAHGPPVLHHSYGMPSTQPSAGFPHPRPGPSGHVPPARPSNALVARHDDDADVTYWRMRFQRLFDAVKGWTEEFDEEVSNATVDRVGMNNTRLWTYILQVAACYKSPQSTPKHAQFLLTNNDHRTKFMTRLILQYLEQEVLRPKFWLHWDSAVDEYLRSSVLPVLENAGYPFEQRRVAHGRLQEAVDHITNRPELKERREDIRQFHVKALKQITGAFYLETAGSTDRDPSNVGLHSIVNMAMDASAKMMQSRLSFSFIWNECGVKFSHDSHRAINEHLIQHHKHMRVAIVVTPGVSFRNDNGTSILARSICTATVMVMH